MIDSANAVRLAPSARQCGAQRRPVGGLAGVPHPARPASGSASVSRCIVGPPAYYPPPVYYPPPAYYPTAALLSAGLSPPPYCPPPAYSPPRRSTVRPASHAYAGRRFARWNTRSPQAPSCYCTTDAGPRLGPRNLMASATWCRSARAGATMTSTFRANQVARPACRAQYTARDRGLCADRRLPQRGAGQPRWLDRLAVLAALRQPRLLRRSGRHAGQRPLAHCAGRSSASHPPAVPRRHPDPRDDLRDARTAASR